MDGRRVRKRRHTWIPLVILLFTVAGCLVYGFCIYNGYLLLNYPSKSRYPVSGVDLSRYQGNVDWEVLARQDIEFAYIKATEGSSHIDETFVDNWDNAHKRELKIGAYHFFSFDSSGETQAENYINTVGIREGMLPPAIDVEYYADKKNNPPEPDELREQLQVMLDRIQEHYQTVPVIYSTQEVWETYLKGHFDTYPLWIRSVITKPDAQTGWTFWQYSNRGRLEGYSGEETFIDLNVFHGDETVWNQWISDRMVPAPMAKESLFARLAGVWHIDGEMTNGHLEQYGKEYHSLQEMFGTGIQYGSELKIQEDGTIEYFIGIGNGGSGQGESADGKITVTITPMEGHSDSEEIWTLREETIESRVYLVMEYYGEELFWSLSH